jgi:hypothetical protein
MGVRERGDAEQARLQRGVTADRGGDRVVRAAGVE